MNLTGSISFCARTGMVVMPKKTYLIGAGMLVMVKRKTRGKLRKLIINI